MVLWLGCCLAFLGCGESKGDEGDTTDETRVGTMDDTEPESDAGVDWSKLKAPDNIDISSCFQIVNPFGNEALAECDACCMMAGFPASSFLNDAHCTCGRHLPDNRDTVCATEASTRDVCYNCCTRAAFGGSSHVTRTADGVPLWCSCFQTTDDVVCAGSVDHAVPEEACSFCCLENAFLNAYFFGDRCSCVGV